MTNHFFALLILLATALAPAYPATPRGDIGKLKKEQQTARKKIEETSKKLDANKKETKIQLSRLDHLRSEIARKNDEISSMQQNVDSIDSEIRSLNDSTTLLDRKLNKLRDSYSASLRQIQKNRTSSDALAFVFASKSFSQAYSRIRYLKQISKWRRKKAGEITETIKIIDLRKKELDSLKQRRIKTLSAIARTKQELRDKQEQTDGLVARLQKEGSSLRVLLKEREQQARALDRKLDRLIAEEQARAERERKSKEKAERERKAAKRNKATGKTGTSEPTTGSPKHVDSRTADEDRRLTGSFESNKGNLLFPVSGRYTVVRGFGRQKHPELKHVETNNSGIDIEVPAGTNARCIFDGKVSAIFQLPGYHNIVMVRHGSYISLYANLASVAVKKGDSVKTGQSLGSIFTNSEEDGRTIFHFELRKERQKLNPLLWVK